MKVDLTKKKRKIKRNNNETNDIYTEDVDR
jgi:hypothetical protein